MSERFSIGRVISDLGRMLTTRWAGLLLVIGVAGLSQWVSQAVPVAHAGAVGLWLSVDRPSLGRALAMIAHTCLRALFAGLLLHVVLIGVEWRGRWGWLAPFRTAVFRFPATFLATLIIAIPSMINAVAIMPLFAHDTALSVQEIAFRFTQLALATATVALAIVTFLGLAPAAAVAEGLPPLAALARSIRLSRKRTAPLFALYLLAGVLSGVMASVAMMLSSGLLQSLLSHGDQPMHRGSPIVLTVVGFASTVLQVLYAAAIYRELRRVSEDPRTTA